MRALENLQPGWGIAVVRVMMGIILIVAGYQKFAGGIDGFSRFLPQLGLPAELGPVVAILELVGGVLILLGLWVRWLGLVFLLDFLFITFLVKLPRPAPLGGWDSARIDLMLAAASLMLVLAGAGKASLERQIFKRRAG